VYWTLVEIGQQDAAIGERQEIKETYVVIELLQTDEPSLSQRLTGVTLSGNPPVGTVPDSVLRGRGGRVNDVLCSCHGQCQHDTENDRSQHSRNH
jgi:hypothetical protein